MTADFAVLLVLGSVALLAFETALILVFVPDGGCSVLCKRRLSR